MSLAVTDPIGRLSVVTVAVSRLGDCPVWALGVLDFVEAVVGNGEIVGGLIRCGCFWCI